jgi:Phytanoyl-CoA dioxygenase (PhyH)
MTVEYEDDCWDSFGSDEEEFEAAPDDKDDSKNHCSYDTMTSLFHADAIAIATHLTQHFVKDNPQIRLEQRSVVVLELEDGTTVNGDKQLLAAAMQQRGFKVVSQTSLLGASDKTSYTDAVICLDPHIDTKTLASLIEKYLCPGGVAVLPKSLLSLDDNKTQEEKIEDTPVCTLPRTGIDLMARHWKRIQAHASTCPWLPSSHSLNMEEQQMEQATVFLASSEISTSRLTEHSLQKAVHNLQQYGYCILPRLLDPSECREWGQAVLESVHAAAQILLERDGVDIYHPLSSKLEPQSYQELSMREDLRMDIRQGPGLSRIRAEKGDYKHGHESIVLTASEQEYGNGIFMRGHSSLLEIVRRTMNPRDETLYRGNIGRWNFGGSGSDGSFQDLRLSPVGGIVSLPGAADQALHADTPHLFENIPDLPAHYINIFAPCTEFDDQVGGTAFVHGSHNLSFTARYCADDENSTDNSKVYPYLVRPCLTVGDVVLFDCRILHFGLANMSKEVERCICYTNTWQNWFHDAKNWDKNSAIFEKEIET